MTGDEFGRALERALCETEVFDDRLGDAIIRAVRAALAQSAPQQVGCSICGLLWHTAEHCSARPPGPAPQPESAGGEPVDIYRDSSPWKPVAAGPAREPPICMGPSARQVAHIKLSELARLRAWEKWGREHAGPALKAYAPRDPDNYRVSTAKMAIDAMPQDAGESRG